MLPLYETRKDLSVGLMSVQFVSKISNLCDHKSPTPQRTDGRHAIERPRFALKCKKTEKNLTSVGPKKTGPKILKLEVSLLVEVSFDVVRLCRKYTKYVQIEFIDIIYIN